MTECKRLFIGGLYDGVTESCIRQRFGRFGNISSVDIHVKKDFEGNIVKTFCYINITISEQSYKQCMQVYNKTRWKGNEVYIQVAKESFVDRLQREREAAKLDTKLTEEVTTVDNGHEEIKQLVVKGAAPGSEVEGKKNWVVGKYGRALPILHIRRKDKQKVIKVDPSKFCHNVKKLDKVDESESKLPVERLTWQIEEESDDLKVKRRIGDFCDGNLPSERKIMKSDSPNRIRDTNSNSEKKKKRSHNSDEFEDDEAKRRKMAKELMKQKYEKKIQKYMKLMHMASENRESSENDSSDNEETSCGSLKEGGKDVLSKIQSSEIDSEIEAVKTNRTTLTKRKHKSRSSSASDSKTKKNLLNTSNNEILHANDSSDGMSDRVSSAKLECGINTRSKSDYNASSDSETPGEILEKARKKVLSKLRDTSVNRNKEGRQLKGSSNVNISSDSEVESEKHSKNNIDMSGSAKSKHPYISYNAKTDSGKTSLEKWKGKSNYLNGEKMSSEYSQGFKSRYAGGASDHSNETKIIVNDSPKKAKIEEMLRKKQAQDNAKRLEGIMRRKKEKDEQQLLIKKNLAAVDKVSAKRIVFDSDEEYEAVSSAKVTEVKPNKTEDHKFTKKDQAGISHSGQKVKSLFSDSDVSDSENEDQKRFSLRPQFLGEEGERLMRLQSRYKNDERFKLDERFREDDLESAATKEIDGEISERDKTLQILKQVIGPKTNIATKEKKSTFKDTTLLKYDPTREDHKEFEVESQSHDTVRKQKKNQSEDKEVEKNTVEEKLPVVSKDRYYDIETSLKEGFDQGKETAFSFSQLFGRDQEKKNDTEEDTDNEEIQTGTGIIKSTWHQEFDSGSSDDGESEEHKGSQEIPSTDDLNLPGESPRRQTFFFTESDARLAEGIKFFCRTEDMETIHERWQMERPDLIEAYRTKRKQTLRRNKSAGNNQMREEQRGNRKKWIKFNH